MNTNCITLNLTSRQANLVMDALKVESDRCYIRGLDAISEEYDVLNSMVSAAWDVYERHEAGEPVTAQETLQDNLWSAGDRAHQERMEGVR